MAARRFEGSWHAHRVSAVHHREVARTSGSFWDAIPTVKNLQCAWQLLLQSANPQANHTLRTTTTTAYGQPWRKSRNRTLRARSPPDDRWIGVEVSNQVRSGGVLGVVGRRLGHDQPETPGSPTWWCGPWRENCRAHKEVVWLRSLMPAPVSTAMASGGDHLGQNSAMARRHLRTPQESQESGNTAGSIRRLPFLTGTSGRQPCCQSVPPRLEFTFGHTQVSTQALPWLRQLLSLSFHALAVVGEASTPAPCGRGCVLWLPRSSGSSRAPQSCMRPHWQTQAGDSNRAHAGSSVS